MQYRRFGRTNLKIPVLSLGGMRFQKSWDQLDFSEISYEEQSKVENILNLANKYGLSHVETAKYYGTSEMQLSMGFKNTKRIPNIIQCYYILVILYHICSNNVFCKYCNL